MTTIAIALPDGFMLDAGSVTETAEAFAIAPPTQPMIDQLIGYLDAKPFFYNGLHWKELRVGCAALCVRWGSYLATLMDASTPLHPDLPGLSKPQPREYSFTSEAEMMRLNIEVSYNIFRLVQIFRQRGDDALDKLLWKAHEYLPMPQKTASRNKVGTNFIFEGLIVGAMRMKEAMSFGSSYSNSNGASRARHVLRTVAPQDADRFLANALASHIWRNTEIEGIHSGRWPNVPLCPHQQRLTQPAQRSLMREVSANMGSLLFAFEDLFDEHCTHEEFPPWPQTATAIANSRYRLWSTNWSMTEVSSSVTLHKHLGN